MEKGVSHSHRAAARHCSRGLCSCFAATWLDAETFRRISMSFDAWVVGFGFSRVLIDLNLMESPWAYSVLAVTILIDTYLLYVFFTVQKVASKRANDDTN